MKPLKFKVWDKTANKMLYFEGIFNKRPFTETSRLSQYESIPKFHELEIMEFTGLHDKNKTEIYFGDIIKDQLSPSRHRSVDDLCVAHWLDEIDHMNDPMAKVEIAGNIHENPELLDWRLQAHSK